MYNKSENVLEDTIHTSMSLLVQVHQARTGNSFEGMPFGKTMKTTGCKRSSFLRAMNNRSGNYMMVWMRLDGDQRTTLTQRLSSMT